MTKVLGLKLTHDAGVCVIEDGVVLFNAEMEKYLNGKRYMKCEDPSLIDDILGSEGYSLSDFDVISVDGWVTPRLDAFPDLVMASYDERFAPIDSTVESSILGHRCVSFTHIKNHIMSAAATAPFRHGYALVCDGGSNPRLYHYNTKGQISALGSITFLHGLIYSVMGYYFGPYKLNQTDEYLDWELDGMKGQYDWPGKLMSYMTTGKLIPEVQGALIYAHAKMMEDPEYRDAKFTTGKAEHKFIQKTLSMIRGDYSDADMLYNIHHCMGHILCETVRTLAYEGAEVCFVGGSALNIKWNNMLREVCNLWVPPFPNDSGSAFGAAASAYNEISGKTELHWDVYSGPQIIKNLGDADDWAETPCGPRELADLIASDPDIIVASLIGRAEAGPRALGHRSLICSPMLAENKRTLNQIKGREFFRPVAPMCMEERLGRWFKACPPDPYMLYEHQALDKTLTLAPAAVHTDGSARVQSVGPDDCPIIHELLYWHEVYTGVPILCNTSANFNGSGFFPDFASAASLDYVHFIWDGETLYAKLLDEEEAG